MRLMKLVLMTLASAALAMPAAAQWPDKPVTIVVGYPPGAATDNTARLLAQELQKAYNQNFIVKNQPGATAQVATTAVARSEPNGYTLLLAIGSHTIVPALNKSMAYDALESFEPIAMIGSAPNMVLVKDDSPFKTLADLVKAAKEKPGKIDYASAGIGTTVHVTAVMFEHAAGITMTHVPYSGSAAQVQALLAGEVPVTLASMLSFGGVVQSGKVRPLAIVADRRTAELPNVPTFAELGYRNILGDNWIGLLAPVGTPKAVVDTLAEKLRTLVAAAEFRDKLKSLGMNPEFKGPAQFRAIIKDEIATYKELATRVPLTSN